MTVYKAIKKEADAAADARDRADQGHKPPVGINGTTNDGTRKVPSVLLTPVAVTKSNIKDTVIKDGFRRSWSEHLRRQVRRSSAPKH